MTCSSKEGALGGDVVDHRSLTLQRDGRLGPQRLGIFDPR